MRWRGGEGGYQVLERDGAEKEGGEGEGGEGGKEGDSCAG